MDEENAHDPASADGIDNHDNPESVDMDMAGSSDDGQSRDIPDEPDQDNQCKKSPRHAEQHSIDRRLELNIEENLKYARYRSNHAENYADTDGRFDHQDSRDSHVSDKNHVTKDTPSKPSNIIYVTNISPFATLEQMKILFGFVGEILDIAMFHFDPNPDTNFKVCFVEFTKHSNVVVAQHLTNTVFIDRAIFVLPFNHSRIPPDKETAIQQGYDNKEYVTNFNQGVLSQVTSAQGGAQIITTSDARLAASSLQTYPQLPINTDPTRVEEIRRTLYIGNLDSSLAPELVLKFFNDMGEVKYIRIAGDENQPTRFAFVEFTHQASVANALLHHGFTLGSRSLKINHSNNPIVKPQPKLEIDDNLRRSHKDSKHLTRSDRRRERSRGYHERRSPRNSRSKRSRDRDLSSRSRRSRSRDRRRSRSRDDIPRRRSRSRDTKRRRSRSRSNERSRRKSSRRR